MTNNFQIAVIDDDDAVRDSLVLRLRAEDYDVSGYESADVFLSKDGASQSDIALIDIRMPGTNGMDLLLSLKDEIPRLAIIMVTGHGDVPLAVRAMKEGALDFIEKPFADQRILESVNKAREHVMDYRQKRTAVEDAKATIDRLTKREHQIMLLVTEGKPTKQIAVELDISPRTVEIHRQRIMQKTKAGSVAELVKLSLTARAAPSEKSLPN